MNPVGGTRLRRWLAAASLSLLAAVAGADEAPLPVEFIENEFPNGFELIAVSRVAYPVTVGVELTRQENLRVDGPLTATVPAMGKTYMASLTRKTAGEQTSYRYQWWWTHGAMEARHAEDVVYQLPYPAGYAYWVSQGFNGEFSHAGQYALDWMMPEGATVTAARAGRVVHVVEHFSEGGADESFRGKENLVYVLHDDGTIGAYLHFVRDGVEVEVNDEVAAGDALGRAGSTGLSQRPHLHFEVFRAADARTRATVPIVFATAADQRVTPQQGHSLMRPHADAAAVAYPLNAIDAAVTCREIVDHKPADETRSFSSTDTVHVHLALGAPWEYALRIDFRRAGREQPTASRPIDTQADWHVTYIGLPLTSIPDPAGNWSALIYLDDKLQVELPFVVE